MDHRKQVMPELEESSPTQIYIFLTHLHLQGRSNEALESLLSPEFKFLLKIKKLLSSGCHNEIVHSLREFQHLDSFLMGEKNILLGTTLYELDKVHEALPHFIEGAKLFENTSFLGKKLIALFNAAQCQIRLGETDLGYSLEEEILGLATEMNFPNIQALVFRSQGFQALRFKDWLQSYKYFASATKLFNQSGNFKDSQLANLYHHLVKLRENINSLSTEQINSLKIESLEKRTSNFSDLLLAIRMGEKVKIQEAFNLCDIDIQLSAKMVFPDLFGTQSLLKGSALELKLIEFLKNKEADSKDCVLHLWGSEGVNKSGYQRLYTLISRVNKKKTQIVKNKSGKYVLA